MVLGGKLWTAGSVKVTGTITELSDVNEWNRDQEMMRGEECVCVGGGGGTCSLQQWLTPT